MTSIAAFYLGRHEHPGCATVSCVAVTKHHSVGAPIRLLLAKLRHIPKMATKEGQLRWHVKY